MKDIKDIKRIHLVPYSHCDYAWTNTRQWHIVRYIEGLRLALEMLKRDGSYTFTVDNVQQTVGIIKTYLPDKMDELKEYAAQGRLSVVNGGVDLVRPSNSGDELFIRNLLEGRRELMETFGCGDIDIFFNADTSAGHSQLPQILRLSGHRRYRFFRPAERWTRRGYPRSSSGWAWTAALSRSLGQLYGISGKVYGGGRFRRPQEGFLKDEVEPKLMDSRQATCWCSWAGMIRCPAIP
jgi:hypothetical protein